MILNIKSRTIFEEEEYVYVPKLDEDDDDIAIWASPDQCLWEGPNMILTKFPLQHLYEQFVPRDKLFQLSAFFKQALDIMPASWADVTAELAAQREEDSQEFTSILELYSYLDDIKDSGNIDDIR